MENEILKKALKELYLKETLKIYSQKDAHIFSRAFENKMQKLIDRQEKPYYKMTNTVGKRIVCFILAVLISAGIAVVGFESMRKKLSDFFIQIFSINSLLIPEVREYDPSIIEDYYEMTYDLSGWTKDVWSEHTNHKCIDYINGEQYIGFRQFIKYGSVININTEGATLYEVYINGEEAIYYEDNHAFHNIYWEMDGYVISISTNIGKDILIELAKSVQKVE